MAILNGKMGSLMTKEASSMRSKNMKMVVKLGLQLPILGNSNNCLAFRIWKKVVILHYLKNNNKNLFSPNIFSVYM